jgi:hypothetical protein
MACKVPSEGKILIMDAASNMAAASFCLETLANNPHVVIGDTNATTLLLRLLQHRNYEVRNLCLKHLKSTALKHSIR